MVAAAPRRESRSTARRRAALGAALIAVLLFALVPARGAQKQDDADLARIKARIAALRTKLESVRGRAKTAADELDAINLELDLRGRELTLSEQYLVRIEDDQKSTESGIAELTTRIATERKVLAARLAAMYRMGRISYLRILLSVDASRNPLEAIGTMSYLVSRDARAVQTFRETRALLDEENRRLADQKVLAEQAHADVLARQRAIVRARRQKAALLARLRSEQASSAKQLAALNEKAERLQRLLTLLYEQGTGRSPDDVRIEEFKGALPWPVHGSVVSEFGRQRSERFATYTINNGIQIESPPGTPVQAVYAGRVLYARWFKGYGNLVIVDHGKRVFSLYGNTKGLRVAAGDRVAAGQTIAEVGESEDGRSGFLYFEMREDNQPVDPRSWLR